MPESDNGENKQSLLAELFWTKTGLMLLSMLVVGVGLLLVGGVVRESTLWHDLLFAVGTGLLASTIFAAMQALLTASATNRVLVDQIAEASRDALAQLSADYRATNRAFLPTHIFQPTQRPDPVFNKLLNDDLAVTRQYLFSGISAAYTAMRLLHGPARDWDVRVIIADAREPRSINERVRYLRRQTGGSELEVYTKVRNQILHGLVGLFLARDRCTRIQITRLAYPSLDRFEVFDHCVWTTLFTDVAGPSAPFPRTLRFTSDSYIYSMQLREFVRVAGLPTNPTDVIEPDMTEDEFAQLFERLTGNPLDAASFAKLKVEFERERSEFVRQAEI